MYNICSIGGHMLVDTSDIFEMPSLYREADEIQSPVMVYQSVCLCPVGGAAQ